MSLHFPELCPFGITPTLLMCTSGSREVSLNGPSMRPSDSSLVKYSETTAGCSRADPMLTGADRRRMLSRKPIRNPYFRPMQTYRAKALSGCRDRAWAHTSTASGVETGCSTAVAAVTVRREKSRQRRSVVYAYCPAPPTVWRENDGLGFRPALHYRSLHARCTPWSISYLIQQNYILIGSVLLAQRFRIILRNRLKPHVPIQVCGSV